MEGFLNQPLFDFVGNTFNVGHVIAALSVLLVSWLLYALAYRRYLIPYLNGIEESRTWKRRIRNIVPPDGGEDIPIFQSFALHS